MDRRTRPRLGVNIDAVWEEKHTARVTDLSAGGCFLDTVGEVRQGEIVGFRVLLPDDDWLYLEGEVRHYHPGRGFGVQFVDLDPVHYTMLQNLTYEALIADRQKIV